MELLAQIEKACRENNHDSVRQDLGAIEQQDIKRSAFLKIIDYYENEKSQFPVGYVILFIEWLLINGDLRIAGNYISKLHRMGIDRERISALIYEHVIKPDEAVYQERFKNNLEILTKNEMLVSNQNFNFDDIKRRMSRLKRYSPYENIDNLLQLNKSSLLLIDVTDMELIQNILDAANYLYLVYDDLDQFYYMLMFEDLLSIRKYIEQNADDAESIVVFAGRDMDNIRNFFINNSLTLIPQERVIPDEYKDYNNLMDEISNKKLIDYASFTEGINNYYKGRGHEYYQGLFQKRPSDIKILIISTLKSTLNQHICKGWYDSFHALGYNVKLLVEERPYERVTPYNIKEEINRSRPDVIFNINRTVNTYFDDSSVRDSLLWIMRYRDHNEVNYDSYKYENENMFVLPHWWEFENVLREKNVPEERICYTVEGIDLKVFSKRENISKEYACDIVSVNNAVGNDLFKLQFYLKMERNDRLKGMMHELYCYMQERSLTDNFVTEDEFIKELNLKCDREGLAITETGKQLHIWFYRTITNCFYRGRVMEWIVDSNITKNIKLWGGSWSNIKKFRDYDMGSARHGGQLSEIYQSSKISLSDNWEWNTHERNFEILASGGFPVVNYIKPDGNHSIDVITNHFRENIEIVLFYGKDDLLNKIQYYLDNPEEREAVSERGRRVVLEKFSNVAVAGNTMDFIRNYYSK